LSGTTLRNTLAAIDLDDADPTVVTYQALVRVKGAVRFALAKSTDTGVVYDETLLSETTEVQKSPWTLVTLRAQLSAAQGSGAKPMLLIGNAASGGAVRIQVLWQQAWWGREGDATYPLEGGLANAGQRRYVSGTPVVGTYPWGVNSPSVRAADRFQLPLLDTNPDTGEAKGMGWKSPSSIPPASYVLQDGEAYYDNWQEGALAYMADGWFVQHQPDRVRKDPADNFEWVAGTEKNVLYTDAPSKTLALDNTVGLVAPGTVVRVVLLDSETAYSVTVESGTSSVVLDQGEAAEFVFFLDGGSGKWLVTQIGGGAVLS